MSKLNPGQPTRALSPGQGQLRMGFQVNGTSDPTSAEYFGPDKGVIASTVYSATGIITVTVRGNCYFAGVRASFMGGSTTAGTCQVVNVDDLSNSGTSNLVFRVQLLDDALAAVAGSDAAVDDQKVYITIDTSSQ